MFGRRWCRFVDRQSMRVCHVFGGYHLGAIVRIGRLLVRRFRLGLLFLAGDGGGLS